jgi:hypothetical protein
MLSSIGVPSPIRGKESIDVPTSGPLTFTDPKSICRNALWARASPRSSVGVLETC